MALFKCDACHHFQETSNQYIGKNAKCPKCEEKGAIYDTVSYIKVITEKYLQQKKLLKKEDHETNTKENLLELHDSIPLDDFDIHNTDIFSKKNHYEPILKWFKKNNIQAEVNPRMMDTTGFFDEVATYIGNHFSIVGSIVNQIRYIQSKKYDTVKIVLSKKNNKEVKHILDFCNLLHKYSFIARYNFIKKDKIIYLTLQSIPKIKTFFNGIWMEWFVFIMLIDYYKKKNMSLPIIRSADITFQNNEKNELDIFFINSKGEPVCIECKTGEFRQDLNKYFTLKKKLNIRKENFILCVFGLEDNQTKGLTSMYEITLVNESTLINHIADIY